MTDFSKEIEIEAPPECVWAIMRDVQRWHEWTPTILSVRLADGGPLRFGSHAIIRQPKLPVAEWLVSELDDIRRSFSWVSSGLGVRVLARHRVEACNLSTCPGGGSRATLSLQYSGVLGGLFAYLLRGLNQRYLELEANGLKQCSEKSDFC